MKRYIDVIVSVLLIVLLLPLLFVIFLVIRLSSRGPALFVQSRIGLNGHVFQMFKFRTMVHHAEKMESGLFSFENDPRITFVGRFLRRQSLDELPQLFNVLFGSMSLVGPRPPVTYELGFWEDYTPEMLKRFTVKPGITGLAQVSGRNDLNWDEKICLDNMYVDQFSKHGVFVDFRILIKTVWVVLFGLNTIEKYSRSNNPRGSISARASNAGRKSSSS